MARRYLIPKSFTFRPEQIEYIDKISRGKQRGEASRWVRDAVDLRIREDKAHKEALRAGNKASEIREDG